jgi:micrococcal nuclease
MKFVIIISLLLSCYAKNNKGNQQELSGKVIKIVDGDTYAILIDNSSTKRIRMEGIDAPERGMAFYKIAKEYLGKLCFGQTVKIKQTNTDKYGRMVAKTYLSNGSELGLLMIKAGYAWHFKKYSTDIQLANAEMEARNKKTGLWVDSLPIAPWYWRKNKL